MGNFFHMKRSLTAKLVKEAPKKLKQEVGDNLSVYVLLTSRCKRKSKDGE